MKGWIEVWNGNSYTLINSNHISVVMQEKDGRISIIMNNGYCYTFKDVSVSNIFDSINKSMR